MAKPIAPRDIKFIEKPSIRKSDAPKPAAEETPRVKGLARGLSRIVCIQAPARPKIIPRIKAVVISGILILKRMVLCKSLRLRRSFGAKLPTPMNKSINEMARVIRVRIKIFLFLLIFSKPTAFVLYRHKVLIKFLHILIRIDIFEKIRVEGFS